MMLEVPQRTTSSMAHSLLMLGNSTQQQGPLRCLGIPTAEAAAAAAAVFVGLSCQLVLFRFSTQLCEEAKLCCL